jgi:orotate phosphoribosyltransferase
VSSRSGHFQLESGHHSGLWFDLDPLFSRPALLEPHVSSLAHALRAYEPEVVCGSLVGGAFLAQRLASLLECEFAFTEPVPSGHGDGLYRVQYRLPEGLRNRVLSKRVAVVDDVISAGSAALGTHTDLTRHGARTVAVGALLVLGTEGTRHFDALGFPIFSLSRLPFDLWAPASCPLCADQVPLQDVAGSKTPHAADSGNRT